MARRKRRNSSGAEALVMMLLAGVALTVIVAVVSAIAHNPVLLALLLGGGGGLVAWRVSARQKRARELAEAQRRQAEDLRSEGASDRLVLLNGRQGVRGGHRMALPTRWMPGGARHREGWRPRRQCARRHARRANPCYPGQEVRAGQPRHGPRSAEVRRHVLHVHHAQVAAVVTTSAFTKQAREYAAMMRIVLFDHDALGGWVARNGPPPWLMVPPPASFVPQGDVPQGKHG